MCKQILIVISCFVLLSCQSTPKLDLSNTSLYLFPFRLLLKDNINTFKFDEKHVQKARQAAKKYKYDILYEVYINEDGTIRAAKAIKKSRYADNETVSKIRHQISEKGFLYTSAKASAFFYGVKIRTVIE